MRDYMDNELNVGDNILIATPHGHNSGASFTKGIITRFTTCFVVFEYINRLGGEQKTLPDKVVKI